MTTASQTLFPVINASTMVIHGVTSEGRLRAGDRTACGIRLGRPRSWWRTRLTVRCIGCRRAAGQAVAS